MAQARPDFHKQAARLRRDLEERESELARPELAADGQRFKKIHREHSRLSAVLEKFDRYFRVEKQLAEARHVLSEESDEEMRELARAEIAELEPQFESQAGDLELALLPADPQAGKDVIVEIRAGTGGDEAALFVGDLLRMYLRFAEKAGLQTELISAEETGLGGYKEAVISVKGELAYEYLIGEGGGHRVQRIPVTESGGRIHTSAATVAVLPEIEEKEVDIREIDLRIDYYRSSGAGGQHVNTTDSAVRITHIPTGVVVACQDERSQHKNKDKAMRVLRARIYEAQIEAEHARMAAEKKQMIGSGDRSQRIRTYNFPQNRVTDHRAGYTSHNLSAVLEGDMLDLAQAVARHRKEGLLASAQAFEA